MDSESQRFSQHCCEERSCPPSPSETRTRLIERQQRLELMSVSRGVERFRKACESRGLADSKPGQRMTTAILKQLIPAIERKQDEAILGLEKGGSGRQPAWWWPILLLSPDKLAVITLRSVLGQENNRVTKVAGLIGQRVKIEREFELFAARQAKEEREARETEMKPRNLMKLMRDRCEVIDERAFLRWRKKAERLDRLPLDQATSVQLGTALLYVLVEEGGGWFEVKLEPKHERGRRVTRRIITMTEEGLAYLNYHREQMEVSQPWLLPMVCPPRPWTRKEAA